MTPSAKRTRSEAEASTSTKTSLDHVIFSAADKSPLSITPKDVCRSLISSKAGRVSDIRCLSNGTIVLVPVSDAQRLQLLNLKTIANIPVVVSGTNAIVNPLFRRKLVYVPQSYTDDDLLDELEYGNITTTCVRRLGTSGVVLLDFPDSTIPEFVHLFSQRFPVLPFQNRPRQCSKCLRFGHNAATCRSVQRCVKCGSTGDTHDYVNCSAPVHCALCGGKHAAQSKACSIYKREQQVKDLQAKHQISFPQARVMAQSYASAARSSTKPSGEKPTPTLKSSDPSTQSHVIGSPFILPPDLITALVAFMADVITGALEATNKNDRVHLVATLATKYFGPSFSQQTLLDSFNKISETENNNHDENAMC